VGAGGLQGHYLAGKYVDDLGQSFDFTPEIVDRRVASDERPSPFRRSPAMPPQSPPERFAAAYIAAWGDRDVDRILEHHTADSVFSAPAWSPPAAGKAEVGQAFRAAFAIWPDLSFQQLRLHVAADHIVYVSSASATQALPIDFYGLAVEPTGRRIAFEMVDILTLEDGLIARKDTYFDALGYQRAMLAHARSTSPAGGPNQEPSRDAGVFAKDGGLK
jgi:ketosteroid isomerase-like protein